jgi:hypothetical protein
MKQQSSDIQVLDERLSSGVESDQPSMIQYLRDCWEKLPDTCPTRNRGFEMLDILSRTPFNIESSKLLIAGWEDCLWAHFPPTFSDIMTDLLGVEDKNDMSLHDTVSRAKEAPIEGETDSVSVYPSRRVIY